MIVATAGHIDHGKTRLVRAMTGIDTDRLPEEKARGISIDLGFAHWQLPTGTRIGFVDVPGHERFVRNMLAGVCGIDYALLVVAADDGVMPQTIEHLQILDLLGIRKGVAAITKTDRVSAARVGEVRDEVAALLAGTSLSAVSILPVSTVSGEGLDILKDALAAAADTHSTEADEDHHFRLAIDRAFTIGGSGTVVTGTVFSGEVTVGARLCISPRGAPVRVRGLRVHGVETARVNAGQRCALNVTGIAVDDVARGDWICDPAIHAPVQRVDAELVLLPGHAMALSASTRVHVHLGAGDEMARVAPLTGHSIAAGTRSAVQLVFDRPVSALYGDRFIVRDSAAQRTLGGGVVLDPFASSARRRTPSRLALLAALPKVDPAGALRAWLAYSPEGIRLDRFETAFNLRPDVAASLYRDLDVIAVGEAPRVGMRRETQVAVAAAVEARLAQFHAQEPTALGLPEAELHRAAAPSWTLANFQALLHGLARERLVVLGSGVARSPSHDATDNPADRTLWEKIYPKLLDAGVRAPTIPELAQAAGVDARALRDMLFRRRSHGAVHRVADDRFYLRSTMAAFAATARQVCAAAPDGLFTAANFRDAVGTGRTLAIQVLECLDGLGITLRVGDARRMHHDPVPILGEAAPVAVGAAAEQTAPVNPARGTHPARPSVHRHRASS